MFQKMDYYVELPKKTMLNGKPENVSLYPKSHFQEMCGTMM